MLALAFYRRKAQKEVLEILYPTVGYVLPAALSASQGRSGTLSQPTHRKLRAKDLL